jgi:2-methylisocitrate lyase-like PEP mutase family enzyme
MTTDLADRFRALHVPGDPLLLPNPWDVGSARVLVSLGFRALATTSSGFAATLGRRDGSVTRDEAIAHGAQLAAAVDVPVSADLENAFADAPAGVAETVRAAVGAGLAGCSVEDWSGTAIYDAAHAADRIAAAVDAAAGRLVITARAENYLHERPELSDTIARLQRYAQAGADVLYAPGVTSATEIRTLVAEVDRPVNVLAIPGVPPVAELAELGVARVSVGGSFTWVALGALAAAGRELLEQGSYGFLQNAPAGRTVAGVAFTDGRGG